MLDFDRLDGPAHRGGAVALARKGDPSRPGRPEDHAGVPTATRAKIHTKELEKGNHNRATLAVARKLVAYLLAVDRRKTGFTREGITPSQAV